MQIDTNEARQIVLVAQKLGPPEKLSTLEIIQHLGHIQIDTISIVQRAHHHIIWTRNENYKIGELDQLLRQRKIFEYWSHAASYLPMESYRYCLPRMQQYFSGKSHWFTVDRRIKKYVLDMIKAEGPKKASDFKTVKKNNGWFDWHPSKKALEQLFMEGILMVTRRDGFHKVYDLKENVLPRHVNVTFPTEREYAEFLIFNQIKNLGLAQADELAYQRGAQVKILVKKTLNELVETKKLSVVTIRNHKRPYYVDEKSFKNIKIDSKHISILSPFDNMVIQRKRLKQIFNFNYQVECYVPEAKRKYGYFCLPIIHGSEFIGRIDIKAQRKEKRLEIRNIFYETGLHRKGLESNLNLKIQEFCRFNECEAVVWCLTPSNFATNGIVVP